MADYHCYPLWIRTGDEPSENVSPRSLPISNPLCKGLEAWASIYDATLNAEYPAGSGFETPEERAKFVYAGLDLARHLAQELHGLYSVEYYDEIKKIAINVP